MTITFTSHCPSDRAGTMLDGQFAPNHVGAATVTTSDVPQGAGNRRGVVCWLHGTQASDQPMPMPVPQIIVGFFQSMQTACNNDGWVFDYPAHLFSWSVDGIGALGNFYNAVNTDPAHGQLCINAYLAWWDHYLDYVLDRYGSNVPILVGGHSFGAFVSALICFNRANTIVGAIMHQLPTLWASIAGGSFVSPSGTLNMTIPNWSAVNIGVHAFDSVTVPTIMGYAENDGITGWNLAGTPNSTPADNKDAIITSAQAANSPMTRYRSYAAGSGATNFDENISGNLGHAFMVGDVNTYCSSTGTGAANTTPSLSQGWIQQVIDPLVPVNTF